MLYLSWQLEPVLLGGIFAMAVAYYLAVGPLRRRLAPGEKYPTRQAIIFGIGLAILFLNEGSPLHDLAERYLLSAHMFQHLLLSYLIAPVLLAGMPAWLLRAMFVRSPLYPVARVMLKPLVTFFTFTLVMSFYHLPGIYNLALSDTSFHHSVHFVLLLASLMVWWPVVSPLGELPRAPYLTRLAYLFLLPVAQTPIFAGITFADQPLYVYHHMPTRAFGLGVMEDQALAGAVMKIGGMAAFGIRFIGVFFNWYRSERTEGQPGFELPPARARVETP